MYGKLKFQENNQLLNKAIESKGMLIACHRGTWGGNVIENTTLAFKLALDMGADMFECDVSKSTDDILYAIHDGGERRLFDLEANIQTLSSEEIDQLEYRNSIDHLSGQRVQRLEEIITHFNKGELYNIDRAWDKLSETFALFDKYPYALQQALFKSPVNDEILEFLNAYPTKYMYMPIVHKFSEIEKVLSYPDINVVGVELIAKHPEHEFLTPKILNYLKDNRLFVWANSINLSLAPEHVLFGGLDDKNGLEVGDAWQELLHKGIQIVQTDWPYQMYQFRNRFKTQKNTQKAQTNIFTKARLTRSDRYDKIK